MSSDPSTAFVRPSQTKIVATIGPASSSEEQLFDLIRAGVDVFRLNMAHATHQEQDVRLAAIRRASSRLAAPVAVLVDLAGPKMRLGELPGGQLDCHVGQRVRFVRTPSTPKGGSPLFVPPTTAGRCLAGAEKSGQSPAGQGGVPELTTTYEPLLDELRPADRVMLADGTVALVVEAVTKDYAECRVVQSGTVRSRQGVNLPGVKLSVAALSEVDRENAVWAARNDIDFLGLSFVRTAADVRQLKAVLDGVHTDRPLSGPQIIAKIEKPEALANLSEILDVADGAMVARGDLGVEIDIAQVAVAQKRIVAECNRRRKPVIIATQMLDSMQHSRLPTRAEVADVANAILDGTDACMLSGETAVGQYPREAVEMMHRIALATEPMCRRRCAAAGDAPTLDPAALNPITEATVQGAGRMAELVDARLIVVATASGATALSLAKNHCYVPTLGVSDSPATLRRMCLYWGVIPLAGAPIGDARAVLRFVAEWGKKTGLLSTGDRVVLLAGTGLASTAHNMVVVHVVG